MPSIFNRHREPSTSPVNEVSVAKLRALLPRRRRSDVNLAEPKRLFHRRSHVDLRPQEVEDKPNRIESTVLDTKSRASSPPRDPSPDESATISAAAEIVPPSPTDSAPVSTPSHSPNVIASALAPSPTSLRPPALPRTPSNTSRPSLVVETNLGPKRSDPPDVFETPAVSPSTLDVFSTPNYPREVSVSPVAVMEEVVESPEVASDPRRTLSADDSAVADDSALDTSYDTPEPRRVSDPVSATPKVRRSSAVSTGSTVGSPRRMTAVLHSPPMPQPIANLPTFSGGPGTPTWGSLALEGGPRSPALSRQNSRQAGTSTAAAAGFPFYSAATTVAMSPGGDKTMSDAEARKATKTMPVMLRMPSQHVVVDDGGEAEDDDEEDDDDVTSEESGPSTAPPLASNPLQPPSARQGSMGMDPLMEESASRPDSTEPRTPPRGYFESRGLHMISGSPRSGLQETPSSGIDSASFNESEVDSGSVDETPESLQTPSTPLRPAMYSQVSQSMINLPTPSATRPTPRARDADLSRSNSRTAEPPIIPLTRVESWALPPPTPSAATSQHWDSRSPPPLKRRLSAGDADPAPPKYVVSDLPHHQGGPLPNPREEEGHERLPPYWCGVHIEGTLARKMEFTAPGVQARDRGWKKHYFVLHGTALFVYKFDPTKVPLRQGEPYLTCDARELEQYLHVHPAPDNHRASFSTHTNVSTSSPTRAPPGSRRNTINLDTRQRGPIGGVLAGARRGTSGSQTPPSRDDDQKMPELFQTPKNRRTSSGSDSVASSTASAPIASHLPFAQNHLAHVYSLHGAESGLAADYKKRLHCVRIRAEGQQFMLQTETARQCVQWIEAFQAGTNVAMDLDVRPMPVQQTLPRRRRRRAAAPAASTTATTTNATSDVPASFDDTPEGNAAAVEAAERAASDQRERERDRMLAEDQAAESHGSFRT